MLLTSSLLLLSMLAVAPIAQASPAASPASPVVPENTAAIRAAVQYSEAYHDVAKAYAHLGLTAPKSANLPPAGDLFDD